MITVQINRTRMLFMMGCQYQEVIIPFKKPVIGTITNTRIFVCQRHATSTVTVLLQLVE
jgi:hypothetical protein